MQAGKVDIHYSDRVFATSYARFQDTQMNKHNKDHIDRYVAELSDRGVGERRRTKTLYTLGAVNEQIGDKPFDKLTKADYQAWWRRLKDGEIKSNRGAAYSHQTKSDFLKDLKAFLRWYDDGDHFRKVMGLKLPEQKFGEKVRAAKNKKAYSREEIEAALAKIDDLSLRFYIALAFDSGARPEEFFNARVKDFKQDDNAEWHLHIDYAKNDGPTRTVKCPLFPELYAEFAAYRFAEAKKNDPLMPWQYRNAHVKLKQLQRDGVFEHITHYKLRHSSWTFWAVEFERNGLDVSALNRRMGETPTSETGNIYKHVQSMEDLTPSVDIKRPHIEQEVAALRAELDNLKQTLIRIEELRTALDSNNMRHQKALAEDPQNKKLINELLSEWEDLEYEYSGLINNLYYDARDLPRPKSDIIMELPKGYKASDFEIGKKAAKRK